MKNHQGLSLSAARGKAALIAFQGTTNDEMFAHIHEAMNDIEHLAQDSSFAEKWGMDRHQCAVHVACLSAFRTLLMRLMDQEAPELAPLSQRIQITLEKGSLGLLSFATEAASGDSLLLNYASRAGEAIYAYQALLEKGYALTPPETVRIEGISFAFDQLPESYRQLVQQQQKNTYLDAIKACRLEVEHLINSDIGKHFFSEADNHMKSSPRSRSN
jgi:hypothetical protein